MSNTAQQVQHVTGRAPRLKENWRKSTPSSSRCCATGSSILLHVTNTGLSVGIRWTHNGSNNLLMQAGHDVTLGACQALTARNAFRHEPMEHRADWRRLVAGGARA